MYHLIENGVNQKLIKGREIYFRADEVVKTLKKSNEGHFHDHICIVRSKQVQITTKCRTPSTASPYKSIQYPFPYPLKTYTNPTDLLLSQWL